MDEKDEKPRIHSSVDLYRQAVDAKNAAQKADLPFQGPDAGKKLASRITVLESEIKGLRERIELLENADGVLDHVAHEPYSG